MVYITCPNCGETMDCTQIDSRQEWTEEIYECDDCGKTQIHRIEYDQNGLVISDKVYERED